MTEPSNGTQYFVKGLMFLALALVCGCDKKQDGSKPVALPTAGSAEAAKPAPPPPPPPAAQAADPKPAPAEAKIDVPTPVDFEDKVKDVTAKNVEAHLQSIEQDLSQ